MIALRLLGGASLESDGEALSGPATQRHRLALLALLCVSHPRPLSREKLMGYLWPERDSRHARKLLNQALHVLRKALGEDAIVSAAEELRLGSPPLECDVIAFESALAQGDRARAAALYAGPLLDGFFLDVAPEFDQWVEQERERLRREWRLVVAEVAESTLGGGDAAGAAALWRRLLVDDPYDARATLGLMEALEALGDRAAAIRQARLHELLLEEEFDAEPDPGVQALADRIRAGEEESGAAPAVAEESAAGGSGEPTAAKEDGRPSQAGAGTRGTSSPDRWRWKRAAAVAALLVTLISLAWALMRTRPPAPGEITRIAVLPLANLTGDPQRDYFVAGMHDALISELAKVGELTVYSRQSVLRYEGTDRPLPEIARELGVDAVVEGAVFESNDSVRISVQLVQAQPEKHLISESFTGPLSQALALQGTVARAVAEATRARVTPAVRAQMARSRAVDPAAQEAYLAGLYHLERATYGQVLPLPERRRRSASQSRSWSRPWRWTPRGLRRGGSSRSPITGWRAVPCGRADEYYPKSKAAALRAIALDDAESQAYASLGFELVRLRMGLGRRGEGDPTRKRARPELATTGSTRCICGHAGRHEEADGRVPQGGGAESGFRLAQVPGGVGVCVRRPVRPGHRRGPRTEARAAVPDTAQVIGGRRWTLSFTATSTRNGGKTRAGDRCRAEAPGARGYAGGGPGSRLHAGDGRTARGGANHDRPARPGMGPRRRERAAGDLRRAGGYRSRLGRHGEAGDPGVGRTPDHRSVLASLQASGRESALPGTDCACRLSNSAEVVRLPAAEGWGEGP